MIQQSDLLSRVGSNHHIAFALRLINSQVSYQLEYRRANHFVLKLGAS